MGVPATSEDESEAAQEWERISAETPGQEENKEEGWAEKMPGIPTEGEPPASA